MWMKLQEQIIVINNYLFLFGYTGGMKSIYIARKTEGNQ